MMNQTKEYQNMPPANSQRYPPNMHYEQDMRRPGERPGTPTVSTYYVNTKYVYNIFKYIYLIIIYVLIRSMSHICINKTKAIHQI